MTDASGGRPGGSTRIVVGRIARAHGLGGELFLQVETDHAEEVFAPGRELEVEDPRPGLPGRLTVTRARPQPRGWLLGVEEVLDRTMAEQYAGRYVTLAREELRDLAEDEYFLHDLLGLRVEDEEGRPLGSVDEVYEAPAGPILGVIAGRRERLVPFRREIVLEVDLEAGRVRVRPPPGLLEL